MNKFEKNAGTSLIVGSILMVVTMVMHPTHMGGHYTGIINTISHSLAIAAIPFCLYGFWGLTKSFKSDGFFANCAFPIMAIGLLAGMLAAIINGLALTFFYQDFENATGTTMDTVDVVLHYSFALNSAMAYVFIGASLLATLFWSIEIINKERYSKWIGYYGALLVIVGIVLPFTGYEILAVSGFRLIIFGLVSWIVIMGIQLRKSTN
jgi:hypothetical protein